MENITYSMIFGRNNNNDACNITFGRIASVVDTSSVIISICVRARIHDTIAELPAGFAAGNSLGRATCLNGSPYSIIQFLAVFTYPYFLQWRFQIYFLVFREGGEGK